MINNADLLAVELEISRVTTELRDALERLEGKLEFLKDRLDLHDCDLKEQTERIDELEQNQAEDYIEQSKWMLGWNSFIPGEHTP